MLIGKLFELLWLHLYLIFLKETGGTNCRDSALLQKQSIRFVTIYNRRSHGA